MKNKVILIIVFSIFCAIFAGVIKASKVTIKSPYVKGNEVVFNYNLGNSELYELTKIVETNTDRVKTRFEPSVGFEKFEIFLMNTPAEFAIRDINIFNTISPFYVSGKNLQTFFELKDIDYVLDGKNAVLKFKSADSKMITKPLLLNTLLLLRIIVICLLALVATAIVYGFMVLNRKKGSHFVAFVLLGVIFAIPLLTFPIPLNAILSLKGEFQKKYCPVFSIKTFNSHSFQKQFEDYFNQNVAFNNINIRLFNTTYYWLLNKSFSFDQGITIGKGRTLFEKGYVTEILKNEEVDKGKVSKVVKDIKAIQNYYNKRGKVFIFVITPSKAIFEEEKLPTRVVPTNYSKDVYEAFVDELNKNKVTFIDSPRMMAENLDGHIAFPKGGIHWADYPKYMMTQTIIDKTNNSRLLKSDLRDLSVEKVNKFNYAYSEDSDLADLLNLVEAPVYYPVEKVVYNENKKPSSLKIKTIGGSFLNGPVDMLINSGTVSSLDFYYYFYSKKTFRKYHEMVEERSFGEDKNKLVNDINKGDIIVLESNQQILSQYGNKHVLEYIDAMKQYALK